MMPNLLFTHTKNVLAGTARKVCGYFFGFHDMKQASPKNIYIYKIIIITNRPNCLLLLHKV